MKTLKEDELELLKYYISVDILDLDDLLTLGREESMNKILKATHKFKIWYNQKEDRWYTYIEDFSKLDGRKKIKRKNKTDLLNYLLKHYQIDSINHNSLYTMANLWEEFIEYRLIMQKKTTVMEDIRAYKKYYVNSEIINMNLSEITKIDLEKFLKYNIEKYKLNRHSYSKLKTPLSKMFQYAIDKGYIKESPFAHINYKNLGLYNEKRKTGKQKAFMKYEQPDIYKIAMDDFISKPYPVPLGILLTFQLGIRLGELVALKWEDIDWNNATIRICRYEQQVADLDENLNLKSYHSEIVENDLKGDYGERIIDLTDDAIYILQLLKEYYKHENLITPWLFYSKQNNDKCHARAFDIRIRKYCKNANFDFIKSMHKIRSTFISNLRDYGMSFEKIREYVGHKDIKTTMNHYCFDLESDQINKERLNKLSILTKDGVTKSDHKLKVI